MSTSESHVLNEIMFLRVLRVSPVTEKPLSFGTHEPFTHHCNAASGARQTPVNEDCRTASQLPYPWPTTPPAACRIAASGRKAKAEMVIRASLAIKVNANVSCICTISQSALSKY